MYRINHKTRIAVHSLPLLISLGLAANAQDAAPQLVIDNVTVVDVRNGALASGQALVIAEGCIAQIVPAGSIAAAADVQLIDGNEAYVVPGYNDMHAHNLNNFSPETSLPIMLANGITGVRQMAPADATVVSFDAEGAPILPPDSPEVLAIAGTILAGPALATPEAATAEVARQADEGTDFIKVTDLPEAAFLAATDEAHAHGLKISGHLSPAIDPDAAIAHGFDSIEHLGPTIGLLLSCSTAEDPIRAAARTAPSAIEGLDFSQDPTVIARLLANPLLLAPPESVDLMQKVLATYSEEKCAKLAADLAASTTWVTPTLTRLEAMDLGNSPDLRNNPDLRYAPKASRDIWLAVGDDFDAKLSPERRQTLADLFSRQLAMVKLFDEAGGKMMAGTDQGGQWIVPGFSLHREFDLLARADLSPLRILQMTTLAAATYLAREADMGTVEVGKAANLVLLSANPLDSVANLHGIDAVVRDGRYLSRADLDAMLAKAEAALR